MKILFIFPFCIFPLLLLLSLFIVINILPLLILILLFDFQFVCIDKSWNMVYCDGVLIACQIEETCFIRFYGIYASLLYVSTYSPLIHTKRNDSEKLVMSDSFLSDVIRACEEISYSATHHVDAGNYRKWNCLV